MGKIYLYSQIKTNYFKKDSTQYKHKTDFYNANAFYKKGRDREEKIFKELGITGTASLVMGVLGRKYISKMEQALIFAPNKTFFPMLKNLTRVMQSVTTAPKNGLSLQHYYIPAKENKKTIIFCHGIIHNITKFFNVADFLHKRGYGVLLLEYRGFGKNSGIPSEKAFAKDFHSAVEYLKKQGISQEQIVLWGFSMGGGVVLDAAKAHKFGGMILNSTFSDMKSAVKHQLKTTPVINNKFFQNILKRCPSNLIPIKSKFKNTSKIKKIDTKILIMHAKDDTMVPFEMSKKLAKMAPNSELYISETGGHDVLGWTEEKILHFLESLK